MTEKHTNDSSIVQDAPTADQAVQDPEAQASAETTVLSEEVVSNSSPFVGRWNKLVSTTNWEKGRIIAEWREALRESDAAVTEYSDEAWAQLVGQVTGQHVGRLRRVHERFGVTREEYDGLFWSHFQAALDWEDAEMWLEGSTKNGWSVAKMRAARWEAVGAPDGVKPTDEEVIQSELDEDSYQALSESGEESVVAAPSEGASSDENPSVEATNRETLSEEEIGSGEGELSSEDDGAERVRPFEALAELPDDVAEAFEQMKLAILTHKLSGWEAISRDDLIASLESLKELALAPSQE